MIGQHDTPVRDAWGSVYALGVQRTKHGQSTHKGVFRRFAVADQAVSKSEVAIRHENSPAVYKLRGDAPCTGFANPYPWPRQVLP